MRNFPLKNKSIKLKAGILFLLCIFICGAVGYVLKNATEMVSSEMPTPISDE